MNRSPRLNKDIVRFVFSDSSSRMFRHAYRLQARDQRDMSRIERREASTEGQSLYRVYRGHYFNSLHVRAADVHRLEAEFAGDRVEFARLVGR